MDYLSDSVWSLLLDILIQVLVAVQAPPVREHASSGGVIGGVIGRDGLSPSAGVALDLLVELHGFPDGPLDERAKRV